MGRLRNNLAKFLCDWVLMHIATEDYRRKIDLLIRQGQLHAELSGGPYIVRNDDEPS